MHSLIWKMLLFKKARFWSTVLGIAVAFFLCATQVGLLVGWCDTTTAIVRHANVDLWVTARHTSAFDYGYAIPANRIYQVRTVPGVAWAEGMLMTWVFWQRPDGQRVTIELVGLDDDLVGGPWRMDQGGVEGVQDPNGVIVDNLYSETLGIQQIGDEAEILGHRAIVRGMSRDVRTFTAAPFVFTSLQAARVYDPYYRKDEITYVLVRCLAGASPETVRSAILAEVPSVEVLTTSEFTLRTIEYWMLETGMGITVVVTAVLGLLVGTVIVSQNLYATTQDHFADYAMLMAIGFERRQLLAILIGQAAVLGTLGILVGVAGFYYVSMLSASTPVVIEMPPSVLIGTAAISLVSCGLASLLSVRSVFRIDPVVVFSK